ncbi:calmodulin-like [Chenopodium quinoa]|uniref:EF-hand domain-containing protein n=1 Tax=Chenopodium quinoa TaxID=63459 RepID=A0A803N2B1_CHEQI|nr:calmodulin-like [Chenopodium quinoa]
MCPTGTTLTPASFSDEPTSGFRRAFDVLDFDHDGKISGKDLRSFYSSFSGSGDDEEMIKAMISVADANKDGYVQYDEFEKILKERREKEKVEKSYGDGGVMEEMFKVMDKDGDGILGVNDLKDYLKLAGLEVGDDEIKAMIKMGCGHGGDGTNGVSFDGFVNIFGSL